MLNPSAKKSNILPKTATMKFVTTFRANQFASRWMTLAVVALVINLAGCIQSGLDRAKSLGLYKNSSIEFAAYNPPQSKIDSGKSAEQRLADLAGGKPTSNTNDSSLANVTVLAQSPQTQENTSSGFGFPQGSRTMFGSQNEGNQTSGGASNAFDPYPKKKQQLSATGRVADRFQAKTAGQTSGNSSTKSTGTVSNAGYQQSTGSNSGTVKGVAYQYPEFSTPDRQRIPGNGLASPNIGGPNEINSAIQPIERGGNAAVQLPANFPANYADLDVYVTETETGRINFGGAYNSDNGIVGQFSIDEKNFDITRWPSSFRDFFNGTAFRGGGQHFRLDLVPGQVVQRYSLSLTEPYLMGTDYSLSVSGYLFDRRYFDWDEQRLGGRVAIGRRLSPDLSFNVGLKGERVTIENPRSSASPTLNADLGKSNLFIANVGLVRDTRDSQFAATEGTFFSATLSQAFGDHNFTRGDFDFRTYKLLYERADGSGRHTLSFGTKLGFSGSETPVFENYIAGGFATMRGFDFRGMGPSENGVRVGGEFQWLNTAEYQFPITADDSIKGVLFCDFGTVEESIEIQRENFRVAPGFGLRVAMPGAGIGAPLAFDFAFPIATATGDEEKVFSFYLGLAR